MSGGGRDDIAGGGALAAAAVAAALVTALGRMQPGEGSDTSSKLSSSLSQLPASSSAGGGKFFHAGSPWCADFGAAAAPWMPLGIGRVGGRPNGGVSA